MIPANKEMWVMMQDWPNQGQCVSAWLGTQEHIEWQAYRFQ